MKYIQSTDNKYIKLVKSLISAPTPAQINFLADGYSTVPIPAGHKD